MNKRWGITFRRGVHNKFEGLSLSFYEGAFEARPVRRQECLSSVPAWEESYKARDVALIVMSDAVKADTYLNKVHDNKTNDINGITA